MFFGFVSFFQLLNLGLQLIKYAIFERGKDLKIVSLLQYPYTPQYDNFDNVLNRVTKVQIILDFFIIGNVYTLNFYDFFGQFNIFPSTECHINIFQYAHACNFTLRVKESIH